MIGIVPMQKGERMSDLIDRQAAIDMVRDVCDAIMSGCDSYYDPETGDEVYKDILEVDAILKCNKDIRIALINLPSAEPERKKGKWIGKEQFANSPEFYSWQCSVCGCVLEDPTLDKPYPFCPNCGSYNGGEEDEN